MKKDDEGKKLGEGTRAVHAGEKRVFRSITTPIVHSSTFYFKNMAEVDAFQSGEFEHYEYGRYGNPTRKALEDKLADLEGGEAALMFDCGMGAVCKTILALVSAGDHIIVTDDIYRKTLVFVSDVLPRFGVEASVVVMGDYGAMEEAVRPNTKVVLSESPTNPYLNIADLPRIVEIARKAGAVSVIDPTFATHVNMKVLPYGVDLVIHSATKYLGGHNDLVAGVVVGGEELVQKVKDFQGIVGGICDPNTCWLILRGMKTLVPRMRQMNESATEVAKFLESHSKVRRVYYPGLPSHRDHELAVKQMDGFGAVVTFELEANLEQTFEFMNAMKLCMIAPSLGGPESLIVHPAWNSYWSYTPEERIKLGILDELVRLSVGLEDVQDVIDDLAQALDKV